MRGRLTRLLQRLLDRIVEARRKSGQSVILYLARKLQGELEAAGYDTRGTGEGNCQYFTVFIHQGVIYINGNREWEVRGPLHESDADRPAQ